MRNISKVVLSVVALLASTLAGAAETTLLKCTAKGKSAVFSSINLVRDTSIAHNNDLVKGLSVVFKSTLSGKDPIKSPVLKVTSTPAGMRSLFQDNQEFKASLFASGSDYAIIIEPKVSEQDGFGTMIEFIKCAKPSASAAR